MKFFYHKNNEIFKLQFFFCKHLIKLCVRNLCIFFIYACLFTFFEKKKIENLLKKILYPPDKVIATKKQGNWQI